MTGPGLEGEPIRHCQGLKKGQEVFFSVLRLVHLVRIVASFYRRKCLVKAGLGILSYASTALSQISKSAVN